MKRNHQELDRILDDTLSGIRRERTDQKTADTAASRVWARVSRSKSVSIDDADSPREIASKSLDPAQEHDERELRALVRQAVSRLGERAAAVFALRYFEGYDNQEIAEILGTSQMVVAVTLH